jgi:hypothetical protein
LDSISSDGTSISKLVDWANYFVKPKAKKAWAGTGEFLPGEWCGFCRAKAVCRARSDFINDVAKLEFRQPALLTDEEFDLLLSKADQLKSYVNDVQNYAITRAIEQNILPIGYKLGTTLTHRKIADPELAAVVLKEKGFSDESLWEPRKLKTLASLEKLNKNVASILGDLVVRPTGSPKLIKASSAKDEFQ